MVQRRAPPADGRRIMDDRRQSAGGDDGRRNKGSSILARILTVLIAVTIVVGASFLFVHWREIQDTGKACLRSGECIVLAPGPNEGLKIVGDGE